MKIKSLKVKPPCKDCDRVLCARNRNDCLAWVEFQENKKEMKKTNGVGKGPKHSRNPKHYENKQSK